MRKNRRNAPHISGRLRSPCGWVKMFDQHLIHPIVGDKDLHCALSKLRLNLGLTLSHCSLFLELIILAIRDTEQTADSEDRNSVTSWRAGLLYLGSACQV